MAKKSILIVFVQLIALSFVGYTQGKYVYTVDLTQVNNDQLEVTLLTPKIKEKEILFHFPQIVPGTYMNSNYGKYVSDIKATDKAGKILPVKKKDDNSWLITNAQALHKISYKVEDTWDATIDNMVYPMAGTNFEAGKNFVINPSGVFGYFDKMKKETFELTFIKPTGFYGATGLKPASTSATKDVFRCVNADELYDSPIMYSLPDTTTIRTGNTEVLIAVYSPNKLATSAFIAKNMEKLMEGARAYLGGKLPVDKYAYIFYFNGEQKPFAVEGAWEHSYSSFYSMQETPQEQSISHWVDIAAHEFFHIVTPLTISSREVKEFEFNKTVLSKHLWLYEGSTEYYAHHMQVWAGLNTPEEFLEKLAEKILYSKTYYNDKLSFTELSKESAGKWKDEYGNVYMKGALISASVDLQLLSLSGGQYGLRNLKHDLGIQFGKDKYFEDDELFSIIEKLTYPQVKDFFIKYVGGNTPIPYEQFFSLAGVQYIPEEKQSRATLGGIYIVPGENSKLIVKTDRMEEFGKKMGFIEDDELVSINGEAIDLMNGGALLERFGKETKAGDVVKIVVNRKDKEGKVNKVTLSAPAVEKQIVVKHQLQFIDKPSAEQLLIRNAWLGNCQSKLFSK